jgi:hypothetical protein
MIFLKIWVVIYTSIIKSSVLLVLSKHVNIIVSNNSENKNNMEK